MSPDELRESIQANLRTSGVVESITANFRRQIVVALNQSMSLDQGVPSWKMNMRQPMSLEYVAVCSIVLDFLKETQLVQTMAVFAPETGLNNNVLCREDALKTFGISASSSVVRSLTEKNAAEKTGSIAKYSIIHALLSNATESKNTVPTLSASTQTASIEKYLSAQQGLDIQLQKIQEKYQKDLQDESARLSNAEESMRAFQKKIEERSNGEMQYELDRFKEAAIKQMKEEEAQKHRKDMERLRSSLKAEYELKMQKAIDSEKNAQIAVNLRQKELDFCNLQARQELLREIETMKQGEVEGKRLLQVGKQKLDLEDQRVKNLLLMAEEKLHHSEKKEVELRDMLATERELVRREARQTYDDALESVRSQSEFYSRELKAYNEYRETMASSIKRAALLEKEVSTLRMEKEASSILAEKHNLNILCTEPKSREETIHCGTQTLGGSNTNYCKDEATRIELEQTNSSVLVNEKRQNEKASLRKTELRELEKCLRESKHDNLKRLSELEELKDAEMSSVLNKLMACEQEKNIAKECASRATTEKEYLLTEINDLHQLLKQSQNALKCIKSAEPVVDSRGQSMHQNSRLLLAKQRANEVIDKYRHCKTNEYQSWADHGTFTPRGSFSAARHLPIPTIELTDNSQIRNLAPTSKNMHENRYLDDLPDQCRRQNYIQETNDRKVPTLKDLISHSKTRHSDLRAVLSDVKDINQELQKDAFPQQSLNVNNKSADKKPHKQGRFSNSDGQRLMPALGEPCSQYLSGFDEKNVQMTYLTEDRSDMKYQHVKSTGSQSFEPPHTAFSLAKLSSAEVTLTEGQNSIDVNSCVEHEAIQLVKDSKQKMRIDNQGTLTRAGQTRPQFFALKHQDDISLKLIRQAAESDPASKKAILPDHNNASGNDVLAEALLAVSAIHFESTGYSDERSVHSLDSSLTWETTQQFAKDTITINSKPSKKHYIGKKIANQNPPLTSYKPDSICLESGDVAAAKRVKESVEEESLDPLGGPHCQTWLYNDKNTIPLSGKTQLLANHATDDCKESSESYEPEHQNCVLLSKPKNGTGSAHGVTKDSLSYDKASVSPSSSKSTSHCSPNATNNSMVDDEKTQLQKKTHFDEAVIRIQRVTRKYLCWKKNNTHHFASSKIDSEELSTTYSSVSAQVIFTPTKTGTSHADIAIKYDTEHPCAQKRESSFEMNECPDATDDCTAIDKESSLGCKMEVNQKCLTESPSMKNISQPESMESSKYVSSNEIEAGTFSESYSNDETW